MLEKELIIMNTYIIPVIMPVVHVKASLCFFSFIAKNCGPLAVPLNGSLTGNETTFPNEVSFSCDEGFILNGSTIRRCQDDGAWSGVLTTCQGTIDLEIRGSL